MDSAFLLGLQVTQPASSLIETKVLYERVGHNTGNLAFHFAIDQQLGGGLRSVDWSAPVAEIDAAGKLAVLPCANQLGVHADYGKLGEKFAALKVPIVGVGLGAQAGTDGKIPAVPQGTLDWVKAIAEHSPSGGANIGVRGEFTLSVLQHFGLGDRAVSLGCPTLFINPDPQLGRTIAARWQEPKRIAVAAGHHLWKHLSRIEASLANMVKATGGSYVGQSPLEMVALTRGEASSLDEASLVACRDYACPEMDMAEFTLWSQRYANVFFDVSAWMEHYRRFDFIIGTRIHGIMLALQAGIPALCVAHDSRTLELCQTMMVPYVLAKDVAAGIHRKDLQRLFEFDPDAFDSNRRVLGKRYVAFLEANGLEPVPWLRAIANAADPSAMEVK